MSERRLCAAFYIPAGEAPEPPTVDGLAGRAGITDLETRSWGVADQPTALGSWDGLDCEANLLALEYFDVLLLTFREDEFTAIKESAGNALNEDGAPAVVNAFRDACIALNPVSAFITVYAWPDPLWFIQSQEERVLNGDVAGLAREGFGLLYVPAADVAQLQSTAPPVGRDVITIHGGLLLFRGEGRDRW
jgi:hypothetical protein